MQSTTIETTKDKVIALFVSLLVLLSLILFLIFFTIITPNPPFPLSSGGGMEINFGTYNEGTGNVEENGIGDATNVVENMETAVQPANPTNEEEIITSENGEDVNLNTSKPTTQNNKTVITPIKDKPREKTAAEILAEKFNKNKGKQNGGDGNSGHAGNEGSPDGNPNTNGKGGIGDNPDGTGVGSGTGKYGFDLKGRSIISPPPLSKDTKEEGKVVVEIVVDQNGNVIKADPNGRGTTTSSSILKAKARQAALAAKFNVNNAYEEQKGSITIIFTF